MLMPLQKPQWGGHWERVETSGKRHKTGAGVVPGWGSASAARVVSGIRLQTASLFASNLPWITIAAVGTYRAGFTTYLPWKATAPASNITPCAIFVSEVSAVL